MRVAQFRSAAARAVKPAVRSLALAALLLGTPMQAPAEIPDYYREPGIYPGRDYVNQHFSEFIDPFSGALKLSYVDLFLPGNGGLDIKLQRTYTMPQGKPPVLRPNPFGTGWTMHFGRVMKMANANFCLDGNAQSTLDNPLLELPDGTRKLFLNAAGYFGTGSGVTWVTQDYWLGRCDANGNFTVHSPDGDSYAMGFLANEGSGTANLYTRYVTRLTDRNGNYLDFSYTSLPLITRLDRIASSDGRLVTLTYTGFGSATRLSTISAHAITWHYSYALAPGHTDVHQLTQVTRPGGTTWRYEYNTALNGLAGAYALRRLIFPQGGTIDYQYAHLQVYPSDAYQFTTVVTRKSTPDGTWTFSYAPGSSYDQTVIATPTHTETYRHYGVRAAQAGGALWKIGLLLHKSIGTVQTETYNWTARQVSNENFLRRDISGLAQQRGGFAPLLTSKTIARDGASYATTYSGYDLYGNPGSIAESGNASRTTHLSYCNNASKWIIRRVQNQTLSGFGSIQRTMDGNCNITGETRFGVTTRFTWSGGNLSSRTDPRGNVTSFSSYDRGIPERENHPEGIILTRVASSAGDVTSETDGEGFTRTYSWDGLHRLTGVGYARAGSNPVTMSWGVSSRTLTRGPYQEIVQYDGFARPVSVTRRNTAGSLSVASTMQYDALGRIRFESYPGSSLGRSLSYDAIGRVTAITQPSPSGGPSLTRRFAYSANTVTETNERGFATVHGYRAFGDPDDKQLLSTAFGSLPSANLAYGRNLIGQLTAVTQGGLTRTYGYTFPGPYLTSEVNPETGITTYGRDSAGNMVSRKVGQAGTTTLGYDGRNRMVWIDHPNQTPDVTMRYFRDDKLSSVTSGAGTAQVGRTFAYDANRNLAGETLTVDGFAFTATYGYDANDQLASLRYPRTDSLVQYSPDALGRPTQLSIANAGTTASLLSAIGFFPSGHLRTYTRANGVVWTATQNPRLWPSTVVHARSGTNLSSFAYTYDGGGNLTSATDNVESQFSAALGYDALDRLTAYSSAGHAGSIAYGPRGDILNQSLAPGRSYSYAYDAAGRLASVSGGVVRTFTYDAYGNAVGDGRSTFVYDDASNLRSAAVALPNASLAYTYDGDDMRVKQQRSGQPPTYFFHTATGQLLLEYDLGTQVHTEYFYLAGIQVGKRETAPRTVAFSLSASARAIAGVPITLTAKGTLANATGAVQFFNGTSLIGTAQLVNGTASLNVTLTQGRHTLRAAYTGDPYTAPAQVAAAIDVIPPISHWLPPILDLLLDEDAPPPVPESAP